jgi:hypothetical protein
MRGLAVRDEAQPVFGRQVQAQIRGFVRRAHRLVEERRGDRLQRMGMHDAGGHAEEFRPGPVDGSLRVALDHTLADQPLEQAMHGGGRQREAGGELADAHARGRVGDDREHGHRAGDGAGVCGLPAGRRDLGHRVVAQTPNRWIAQAPWSKPEVPPPVTCVRPTFAPST